MYFHVFHSPPAKVVCNACESACTQMADGLHSVESAVVPKRPLDHSCDSCATADVLGTYVQCADCNRWLCSMCCVQGDRYQRCVSCPSRLRLTNMCGPSLRIPRNAMSQGEVDGLGRRLAKIEARAAYGKLSTGQWAAESRVSDSGRGARVAGSGR